VLHAGKLAGVDRQGTAVAPLDKEHRALHGLDSRDRAVMQPGVADRLADEDPLAARYCVSLRVSRGRLRARVASSDAAERWLGVTSEVLG
jgi:hypothetical protein